MEKTIKDLDINFDEMVVYDFYSTNLDLYKGENGCIDEDGYVETYDSFQHYDHSTCYHR